MAFCCSKKVANLGFIFLTGAAPTAAVEDLEAGIPARIASERIEIRKQPLLDRTPTLRERARVAGKACQGYRACDTRGLGPTLCESSGGPGRNTVACVVSGRARPLSPREALRMQGFPERVSHYPIDGQALRHPGNAVAVPLARALGASIASGIDFGRLS